MTDFLRIDLTVASTRDGEYRHLGFDVLIADWPTIRGHMESFDNKEAPLRFREEKSPRDNGLGSVWMWVWVVMNDKTPLRILMYLAELSAGGDQAFIRCLPKEFP